MRWVEPVAHMEVRKLNMKRPENFEEMKFHRRQRHKLDNNIKMGLK
jgi:hypothetical protein